MAGALLAVIGCGGPDLLTVTLPDMSRSDASVQAQIREAHAEVMRLREAGAHRNELGRAYGDLGMLLQAAEYPAAAESAYLNAQKLVSLDSSWPYYLGHVYRDLGQPEKSLASFERTLELQRFPGVPSLVWLARAHADQGRLDEAVALFERAQSIDPRSAAVKAGLGQAALSRGDHAAAVTLLEEALALDPRGAGLHASLATAYRALGDTAKADRHARQWKNVDMPLVDPRTERLSTVLRSAISYELSGLKEFDEGRWSAAAGIFREGLTLTAPETPIGRSLRHKLGIALYLGGDPAAAIREFEEAVRLAPAGGHDEPASRALYSLGIVMGSSGDDDRAIGYLARAVAYDATSLQSRLALGDALRRAGRDGEAMKHYAQALEIDGQAAQARFGYALAQMRLRRYAEARAWLEDAVRAQPDKPEFAHALARLLATAPDDRVRDGQRAGEIVGELFKRSKRTDVGETMAMVLAELGQFEEAAGIQRGVLAAAQRAGLSDDVRRMTANLRLYEQRRPCRTPWPDDDPIHRPGPPVSPQLAALVTS